MAIFRRYAAMFRVGTSFIFSSIKSRSASVTLNLICTVLFRPSIASHRFPFHSEGLGHFPTSNFQPTRRSAGGRKYGSGYPLPMLATKVFYLLCPYPLLRRKSYFAELLQKKNAAISKKITTLSKSYSVLSRTFSIRPLFRLRKSLSPLRSQSVFLYRSYYQEVRRAAAAACSSPSAFLKGTGLRIYCNGA